MLPRAGRRSVHREPDLRTGRSAPAWLRHGSSSDTSASSSTTRASLCASGTLSSVRGARRAAAPGFVPFSAEIHAKHWFGADPFGSTDTEVLRAARRGLHQFDVHVKANVREDPTRANVQGGNDLEQTLDVWKRAGDAFVVLGFGAALPVSETFAPFAGSAAIRSSRSGRPSCPGARRQRWLLSSAVVARQAVEEVDVTGLEVVLGSRPGGRRGR